MEERTKTGSIFALKSKKLEKREFLIIFEEEDGKTPRIRQKLF